MHTSYAGLPESNQTKHSAEKKNTASLHTAKHKSDNFTNSNAVKGSYPAAGQFNLLPSAFFDVQVVLPKVAHVLFLVSSESSHKVLCRVTPKE